MLHCLEFEFEYIPEDDSHTNDNIKDIKDGKEKPKKIVDSYFDKSGKAKGKLFFIAAEKNLHDNIVKEIKDLDAMGKIDKTKRGAIVTHECYHDKLPGEPTDCGGRTVVDSWGGWTDESKE